MKEFAKRFSSFMLAALFLLTTVGFSALIFWQANQQNDQTELDQQALQQALNEQTQNQTNNQKGDDMLQGTKLEGFTPSTTPVAELQVTDVTVGTGEEVQSGATITAHYTGALVSNGVIFQSSLDTGSPFTSPLSGLIAGWQEGIPGMKVGGVRRLVIPYAQAYGEAGSPPDIPAKADLVFDIELISVEQ